MFSARYGTHVTTCKRFVLDRIEETESSDCKNGHESHRTQNQESMCWRGPAEI
jgi:hypothetical protein